MRNYPTDSYEKEEAKKIKAPDWMLEQLKLNPEYVSWGVYEDYMTGGEGWTKAIIVDKWQDLNIGLDELNEVVDFYFEVEKPSRDCDGCESTGYNSKTLELSNNFYSHSSSTGKGWNSEITQEEMEMLIKKQRLGNPLREVMPSLEAINNANRTIGGGNFLYNHDAINRMLLIEFRAKKLGIFGKCRECHGEGSIYTGPCRLSLTLWLIHPRKGASRGVLVKEIQEDELEKVYNFLHEADLRNEMRFSKVEETLQGLKGVGKNL